MVNRKLAHLKKIDPTLNIVYRKIRKKDPTLNTQSTTFRKTDKFLKRLPEDVFEIRN